MNRKRAQVLAMLVAIAMASSGCASLKDKFIRKPKEEEGQARRYYVVKEYDVHPNMELYTKRYVFWKNWHKELLEVLDGGNQKKIVVATEQSISNLYDMKGMLVDEKGDELQGIIDEMSELESKIKTERVTQGNRVRIRKKLENLAREIKKKFSYRKVQGLIRDDFRRE